MADSRWQQVYSYQQAKRVTVRMVGFEVTCNVSERLLWDIKNACDAEFVGNGFATVATANVTLCFAGREVKYDVSARLAMKIKLDCDAEFSGNFISLSLGAAPVSQAVVMRPFPDFFYPQAQHDVSSHHAIYTSSESAFSASQAGYADGSVAAQVSDQHFSGDELFSDIEVPQPVSQENGYFYQVGQSDDWQYFCPPAEGQEVNDDSYSESEESQLEEGLEVHGDSSSGHDEYQAGHESGVNDGIYSEDNEEHLSDEGPEVSDGSYDQDDDYQVDEEQEVSSDSVLEEDAYLEQSGEGVITPGFSPGFFQASPPHTSHSSYSSNSGCDMSPRFVSNQS